MVKKKRVEAAEEVLEELYDEEIVEKEIVDEEPEAAKQKIGDAIEVVPIKNLVNANRLRLRLEEFKSLEGAGFNNVTIDTFDMRTQSLKGCVLKNSIFKNVNMQGCDFSEVIECTGNTFINCDMRWGRKPDGFKENNKFENTGL